MQSSAICGDCSRLAFCGCSCAIVGAPAWCAVSDSMVHAPALYGLVWACVVSGICSGSVLIVSGLDPRHDLQTVPAGYNVRAYVRCLTPSAPAKAKRVSKSKLSALKLCYPDRIQTPKIAPKNKKAVKCAKRIGLPNSGTARKILKRA